MSYREMVEMMGMDDRRRFGKVMFDRHSNGRTRTTDRGMLGRAWYGGDYHKVWLEAEGDRTENATQESRLEAGWERIISAWWSVRAGLRHDAGEGPARDWAGVGFAGLAPGFIDTRATLYLGEDGRSALRMTFERDLLFTQRLVLQPKLELDAFGKDDPEKQIGSGLSSLEFGLRLRYEWRREFAPYLGLSWTGHFGETADLREAAGDDSDDFTWLAGARAWF
jgi:copper resistance protein B